MPRQPRIQFPGACYHVMARGDRREPIVFDDQDRARFVDTLAHACGMTGWRVFAWVLMDNHYHFVIQTPEANLVDGMKWLQNTWTRRLNTRHGQWGHVFGGRYKAILVEAPAPDTMRASEWRAADYLSTLIDYVHLNPIRAGLVEPGAQLEYAWSSLSTGYAVAPSKRARWLEVRRGLATLGHADTVSGRRAYMRHLDQRAGEENDEAGLSLPAGQGLQSTLRRGWYWGSEAFKERLLGLMPNLGRLSRGYRSSPAGRTRDRQDAEELLKSGMRWFRIDEPEVLKLPRGDKTRVALAWALCRRTCVPQKWVAEKLGMKSAANVSQQVRRFEKIADQDLPKRIRDWRKRLLKFVT